jgi:hypothetical protein
MVDVEERRDRSSLDLPASVIAVWQALPSGRPGRQT